MKKHWLVPAFAAFCFFTAAYRQYNCYPQSNWTFGPQAKKTAIMWVVGHAGVRELRAGDFVKKEQIIVNR
ncbi:MAG: hypothetical protein PHC61_14295 [Chitinivibrionales bacterium]|nr:hypothetical protein [Chitinivibrionales bacterium]